MTLLVTGGTGFIGSNVLRGLVDKGERPIAYDLMPDFNLIDDISDKIEIIRGDVLDFPNLMRVTKNHEVDRIVHMAYLLIDASRKNPYMAMEINIQGTNNVLEVARILDLERVVLASSVGVYGSAEYYGGTSVEVDEESSTKPTTLYGACKVLNEFTLEFYSEKYGLDLIALRPTQVYGPGRTRGGVAFMSRLIEDPARGKPVVLDYPPDQEHDWLYVEDAADAFVVACFAERPKHNIFNIAGGTYSLGEVANYVKELIPDAKIAFGNKPVGWVSRYNSTRAEKELGFEPKYSLKNGVKEIVESAHRKGEENC